MSFRTGVASTLLATTAILAPAAPAAAQAVAAADYDLPAQDLETSLRSVARTSGQQIIIVGLPRGQVAPALKGQYTVEQAVRALLTGTDIRIQITPSAILVGDSASAAAAPADNEARDDDAITVTGSRIKGARLASPEIRIDRQDIQRAGFGDLGQALRSLPQNFAGGQNPGVGLGASSGGIGNQNVTGGSAVNLRGLGADATLTLLNGHRLSFGGLAQGIDISTIPTEAIERIEVVPDGSSALYGSDAVAGVVNVLLRRSFEGLALNARVGTSTDGGGLSQQYQAVAGETWQTGNLLVSYGYRRNAKIEARDRPYSVDLGRPYPLVRGQNVHSVVLSGSQELFGAARLTVDGTFAARRQASEFAVYGGLSTSDTRDRSLSVTPSLEMPIAGDWSLTVVGTYARTKTKLNAGAFRDGIELSREKACYCHSLHALEAYAEGTLIALPAGNVRGVIGGGYRRNRFDVIGATSSYGGRQRDAFLFGELQIPLISQQNEVPFVKSLVLTAAGRFDDYNQVGNVGTPKLGVVYSPVDALDLKLSWGRSFKAPALAMQFQPRRAYLLPASFFTGGSTASGTAGLVVSGGADSLKPERATSLTGTVALHPSSIPGLTAEVSLFRVKYTDRVITPIGNFSDALNTIHASYLTLNPTSGQILAAIADAGSGFTNYTGQPLDRVQVIYFVDNHNRNVAAQKIEGIDANLGYRHELGGGAVVGTANASWLRSKQRSGAGLGYFDLAGTVWNPPHFRGRASIGWETPSLQIFTFLNYLGGVDDRRAANAKHGKGMFTADLSVNLTVSSDSGWLDGLRVGLVAENLFNKRPPYLTPAPYSEPYDSTNYSPIGRFLALSLSKTY